MTTLHEQKPSGGAESVVRASASARVRGRGFSPGAVDSSPALESTPRQSVAFATSPSKPAHFHRASADGVQDRLVPEVQVVQHVRRLLAALGDGGDVEVAQGDVVAVV